jgi:chromosome segregation ATPase
MLALIGPLSLEEYGMAAAGVLLPMVITWRVMLRKVSRVEAEYTAALEKLRAESGTALQTEQSRGAALAAEAKKAGVEAAASFADLQQRFNTQREVADRRANDASQQTMRLESELASARELAAQLAPTQSRIKDLETALGAEQGRVRAQEQAIEATNARAADFEKRMIDAKELLLKQKGEMQETAVELKKMRDEQAAYAAAGGPEAELAKAREATQQAETKIVNLQRALKAAETRTEMVQKEFMNAVGVATAPTPGTPASSSDKKLRELEEKLGHMEAEARKRGREDGYKIAELEYRLSEAQEMVRAAQAPALPESAAVATALVIEPPAPMAEPIFVPDRPAVSAISQAEAAKMEAPSEEAPVAELPPIEIPAPIEEAGIPMPTQQSPAMQPAAAEEALP